MPKRHHAAGEIWLTIRPETGNYEICWYDPLRRKTRRKSTGSSDRAEAERQRAEFVLANRASQRSAASAGNSADTSPTETHHKVADIVWAYYDQHAKHQAQKDQVKAAHKWLAAFFKEATIQDLVDDVSFSLVQEYADERLEAGRQPATVNRELMVLRAALRAYAAGTNGRIQAPIVPALPDTGGVLSG